MTLEFLLCIYMGGLVCAFATALVFTSLSINLVNQLYIDRQVCVHQHLAGRVGCLLQFFVNLARCVYLLTIGTSFLLIFRYQMQLPHSRPFLIVTWIVTIALAALAYGTPAHYFEFAQEDEMACGDDEEEEIDPNNPGTGDGPVSPNKEPRS